MRHEGWTCAACRSSSPAAIGCALRLAALTAKDLADLEFVAAHADIVQLSFANTADEVALLQRGMPSRAEVTDAAMSDRAECVMLNKGPYVLDAVRMLDDILRRMQQHQVKKQSMLRSLHLARLGSAGATASREPRQAIDHRRR
ncbi:hypothetical protein [Duganella hordei]|uniref:hypothetical protein n=1 Tax=Duganella hordei TaxID=2865934 RepID=UPI0030E8999B